MVKELVLTDKHSDLSVYGTLDSILSVNPVDRIFDCGDFREGFTDEQWYLANKILHKNPEFVQSAKKVSEDQKRLDNYVNTNFGGDFNKFFSSATAEEKKFCDDLTKLKELLDGAVWSYATAFDYGPQNDIIKNIKNKHKIKFFGVPGNHDNSFLPKIMNNVDWLTESQSLLSEKVLGVCATMDGFVDQNGRMFENQKFYGPENKYIPIIDDDYFDLSKSKIYNENKGKSIDLIVSHHSGDFGDNVNYIPVKLPDGSIVPIKHAGKGIRQLGIENPGMINYCGHLHKGLIYKDPETGTIVLRPGTNNVFHVERDGKDIKWVYIYEIDKSKKANE